MAGLNSVFNCRACGTCCLGRGGVRLDEGEAQAVAGFLKMELRELRRVYLAPTGPPWDILTGPNNYCLFHQADGSCLIHPVKPAICRAWPFLPGILNHESAFKEAKAACPGLVEEVDWHTFRNSARP